MYSKKDDSKEVQDFMKGLGFPSQEEGDLMDDVVNRFAGKEVVIVNGGAKVVGVLHSPTLIFGNFLNLTQVKEDECTPGILKELHYYHPRNFKPELEKRNFGFVSAGFVQDKDPQKDDLLVVPIDGCKLTCEGETVEFPVEDDDEEDGE
ncbi:MAG TPA: hypothetical protein VGE63_02770 [Candidatus Paceibacterota bacterium]